MKNLLSCAVAIFLIAGTASGQRVQTDFDPSFDFQRTKTFSWQSGGGLSDAVRPANDLIDARVRRAVTRELGAQGIVQAHKDPGILVTYRVSRRDRVDVDTFDYRVGPRWRAGWSEVMVTNYTEGTLVLDLIDAKSNRLVWRAYCTGVVDGLEQAGRKIDKAAKKAFKAYPPDATR